MNEIDFISIDQYLSDPEWEGAVFPFGDGCISIKGCSFLEQEIFHFGDGYVKVTECSFDYKKIGEALNDGNRYKMKGEILDENFNVVGNLDIQGHLCYLSYDDRKIDITYDIEIDLEVNQSFNWKQKMLSLSDRFNITEYSVDQGEWETKGAIWYKVKGEILDKNSNIIGNLDVQGPLWSFNYDDYKINIHYGMGVNLEGDVKKILSLSREQAS
ncbi:hypothetical protein [Wolbachia endosymbiont of Ctenocephalides felis wCfeJ]|uniref:hypothetical protein n=1 Tax=Wolbachia endosymbiont of Ctenocephalides felis wCfeJ TaxID=2732594 RepID=UPI001446752A|nr:hypothetical protein [Wolbachia endosymbiont of Ctenocephalides felis wCfeJ]WCR58480.1 MAG: hypothetical protein PG980_000952 [Wolbachia endosymbiont of Ctenocephalides felis wCfeJ]